MSRLPAGLPMDIPVLLMSASPPLLRNYKVYKADDFIEKPFDIPVLDKKMGALLTPPPKKNYRRIRSINLLNTVYEFIGSK